MRCRPPRETFAEGDARLLDEHEREGRGRDQDERTEHADEPVTGDVAHREVSERRGREHQREHDPLQ